MDELKQPLQEGSSEPGHSKKDVLDLQQFLDLLRKEEDYWAPEEHNTSLMITRLRKIFYDKWGWDKQLIRGAAAIKTRYRTVVKQDHDSELKRGEGVKKLIYTPVHRVITYTDQDRVFGDSRVGQVPEIYKNDHQEVRLPEGAVCDMAHILAGLDALNYKRTVSPLPQFLSFLYKLFPHVDSNVDIVTWLGDIASSSADFLFDYIKNGDRQLTEKELQEVIDRDASASDMLGDIEPYVIAHHYKINTASGMRVTEILQDYYFGDNTYRKNRYLTFCEAIGLKWNGEKFENEESWIKYYSTQLKNSVSFVVFSQNERTLKGLILPLRIWLGGFKHILKLDKLLRIFLTSLKKEIISH